MELSLSLFTPHSAHFKKDAGYWTVAEDEALAAAVRSATNRISGEISGEISSQIGHVRWAAVAAALRRSGHERTGKQCAQRWDRVVRPSIRRGAWTEAEDALLLSAVAAEGPRAWVRVARRMQHRSDIQCRARFMQLLRKQASADLDLARVCRQSQSQSQSQSESQSQSQPQSQSLVNPPTNINPTTNLNPDADADANTDIPRAGDVCAKALQIQMQMQIQMQIGHDDAPMSSPGCGVESPYCARAYQSVNKAAIHYLLN